MFVALGQVQLLYTDRSRMLPREVALDLEAKFAARSGHAAPQSGTLWSCECRLSGPHAPIQGNNHWHAVVYSHGTQSHATQSHVT